MKKLAACLALAFAASAIAQAPAGRVETGSLGNAPYRIDMPEKWNGILLVYYHGYSEDPVAFEGPDGKAKPNAMGEGFAKAGYAVAQSGYSVPGFALEQAIPETEALREYAIAKYGQPKETYVLGHCHITGPETAKALDELIQWKRTGVRPASGPVPVAETAK